MAVGRPCRSVPMDEQKPFPVGHANLPLCDHRGNSNLDISMTTLEAAALGAMIAWTPSLVCR